MLVQVVSCYLEAREVLKMLNVPWEGNCPVTPPLLDLDSLGLIGRCPTKYQILDLPPNSKPNAILQGFCDSSCHNTVCSQWGNFRCMNYTVPVDISMLEVSDSCEEEVMCLRRVVRTEYISVGCVCRSWVATKLGNHIVDAVD
ncbi:hypothetical protein J6590_048895 [Homalodisca vitripennis]|nr:hypothetical protein J6590_048895 [Homalodisca vitripennis]